LLTAVSGETSVLARDSYKAGTSATAADTNERREFCANLQAAAGCTASGRTTVLYREEARGSPCSAVLFPGSGGGVNWGGTASDPTMGYVFVNDGRRSIGWIRRLRTGRGNGYRRNSVVGPTSRFQ
jgi:hypothetical protein